MKRKTLRAVHQALRRLDTANRAAFDAKSEIYEAAHALGQAVDLLAKECPPAVSLQEASEKLLAASNAQWNSARDIRNGVDQIAFVMGLRFRRPKR